MATHIKVTITVQQDDSSNQHEERLVIQLEGLRLWRRATEGLQSLIIAKINAALDAVGEALPPLE